ncbi:hypothetical protein [Sulfolobus tengchongensis spindle-shaped virus 3]|nr:hypothetical protein [Sulfolobus tengchongensis spindle-shaped virus 3]
MKTNQFMDHLLTFVVIYLLPLLPLFLSLILPRYQVLSYAPSSSFQVLPYMYSSYHHLINNLCILIFKLLGHERFLSKK